jgi:hypothetical protein
MLHSSQTTVLLTAGSTVAVVGSQTQCGSSRVRHDAHYAWNSKLSSSRAFRRSSR